MEYLYLVDTDDNVIGKIERQKAHKGNALHRSSMVFVLNSQNNIFILERANKETFPNVYDASCTFHVPFGESYQDAAVRELQEELSIKPDIKLIGRFIHHDSPEHQIVSVFVGNSDRIGKIDPDEAYSGKWCTLYELKEIINSGKITP